MSTHMNDQAVLAAADRYLAKTRPVVTAPRATMLEPLQPGCERYVVAADGIYLQVDRPWMQASIRVSKATTDLPFGAAQERLDLRCGAVPRRLLQQFLQQARAAMPNETASWITWDENATSADSAWTLVPLGGSASSVHVTFDRPVLPEGVHRVIDIHSHGALTAFFSDVDDTDDRNASEAVIAMVVGCVEEEQPKVVARLCVLGQFMPINGGLNAERIAL